MAQFVHLHVHTQYSILDGAASIPSIIARSKEYAMEAVAITDHGNMYGAKEFYDSATKAGIKPIIGCETYIVADRLVKNKDTERRHHLILLAKNATGYHNLIKLVSMGFTEGSYYGKPRIDHKILAEHHEGIICCSACIAGELPKAIRAGNIEEAERIIEWYKSLFGDDYYIELQRHKPKDPTRPHDVIQTQDMVNPVLVELARKHGVKYICSNDVHFTDADDAMAHDHLICLNTGKDLDDPTRLRYTGEEYFKSPEEMAELFADYPESLEATVEIASKVEVYNLNSDPLMPNFDVPESLEIDEEKLRESLLKKCKSDEEREAIASAPSIYDYAAAHPEISERLTVAKQFQYLTHLVYEGAHRRYGKELGEALEKRIAFELSTIENMGFPGYFLIVWDYIRAARELGVSVGPGRGSAAGSVVAYCLKITNIDPIKYDLLFERFLNPDRISLPDVDVDFDEDGRADVLGYVIEKYGRKRVAQIVTFGTMAPKMAIKDVARVQKLPLPESDRLTKLIPDKIENGKKQTPFEWLYETQSEFAAEKNSDNPLIQNTLRYAEKLEGSVRQTGVHACGVIIGKDDLEKFAPIATAKDADLNVVQFEGKFVESVGLIKMDFLGLKTLSIIKDALDNIKRTTGRVIDIDAIPLDDKKTYALFSHGDTTGIFQFESPGMKKHLRALKPTRFEDLIAMNALYRPGPMEKIPNFIARKQGKEAITYDFPEMEKYLYDTYGITVYQEQVMLLSQQLAGFTGGEADTLRKAMGKKQKEVLDKMKTRFMEGAMAKGHDEPTLQKIWGEWEAFASYAFNKSHATCYAYVAYQTAYLKAHYPAEFMAALLSRNITSMDKLTNFMDESRKMKIRVLGPDINKSIHTFSADKEGNIRFGLGGIKGVGEAAVKELVSERERGGDFKDIFDFVERINLTTVNKKAMENMTLAGVFDSVLGFHRSKLLVVVKEGDPTFLDQIVRYGSRYQQDRDNAQQSLFGGMIDVSLQRPVMPPLQEWDRLFTLNQEKLVTGMYLSSHPLDEYSVLIRHVCNTPLTTFSNLADVGQRDFIAGGMVTGEQHLTTASGRPFGKFKLEDYSGEYEFALFGKDYEQFRPFIYKGYFLMLKGSVRPKTWNPDEMEVKINHIIQLQDVGDDVIKEININIFVEDLTTELRQELTQRFKKSKGKTKLNLRICDGMSSVAVTLYPKKLKVHVTQELLDFLTDNSISFRLTS
ncbi:MAG: DNA polymerase III subunit alpha [Tidjanibacter sp.]|nr:DNA polymerase III subunit alpha [Tidjanibacter sp.]